MQLASWYRPRGRVNALAAAVILAAVLIVCLPLDLCASPQISGQNSDGTRPASGLLSHGTEGAPYGHWWGSQYHEPVMMRFFVRDDFLVNDDTTGGCHQYSIATAMAPGGRFLVVWQDWRDGDTDIYGQMYESDGTPAGSNFRVNDDAERTSVGCPAAAFDSVGGFVVAWEKWLGFGADICVQRYDSSGTSLGDNFRANEIEGSAYSHQLDVAVAGSGDFLVVWTDERDVDKNIYAQSYRPDGEARGANFRVNDDNSPRDQTYPVAAMDAQGNFVVAWRDEGDPSMGDICARRYLYPARPKGARFTVNDDITPHDQDRPCVAMNQAGRFVIAWIDRRESSDRDIYLQDFDELGKMMGPNLKVNSDTRNNYFPSVAMNSDGDFAVTWQCSGSATDVRAKCYDSLGTPYGPDFRVNDNSDSSQQKYPAVALNGTGSLVFAWHDTRDDYYGDVYSQISAVDGTPSGSNFKVNDDIGSGYQGRPSVAMGAGGFFAMVWEDSRYADLDIYGQLYDSLGSPQGQNFRVVDDTGGYHQRSAAVGMKASGDFAVVWTDDRNSDDDIYLQRYDNSGSPLGPNTRVNDDVDEDDQEYAAIAVNEVGKSIVVWVDHRDNAQNIFLQLFDSLGVRQGVNAKANDEWGACGLPSVAIDGAGGFVVVWGDYRDMGPDVYAQRFDSTGTALGSNFRVNDSIGYWRVGIASVGVDLGGSFVVAWDDRRNGSWDIYAQRFDSTGARLDGNFRVNDDPGMSEQSYPAVCVDRGGGRFLVVWEDYRNPDGDPEIFAQKFENGIPVGPNFQVNQEDAFPGNLQNVFRYHVACNQSLIAFTWMDNRRHKGFDIYGKLADWESVGVAEKTGARASRRRLRVYPNPFTDYVVIRGSQSEVMIHDVCGRLIARTDGCIWDGRGLQGRSVNAGVYFLRSTGCEPVKLVKLR